MDIKMLFGHTSSFLFLKLESDSNNSIKYKNSLNYKDNDF